MVFFSVLLSMLNKVYVKKSNDLFFFSHGFIARITTDDFDLFYPLKPCLNINYFFNNLLWTSMESEREQEWRYSCKDID